MTISPLVKSSKPTEATNITDVVKKRNPTIEDFKFRDGLPTAEELPDSDDKPVESELQELVSGLLKTILLDVWRDRTNWIFGLDLGFYYDPDQPAIAPDGFLSLAGWFHTGKEKSMEESEDRLNDLITWNLV
jgi:Uma2 family endonuclease